jgi:hypothetical protein
MPESPVKADFKDVWNAVTDVATLMESNTSYAMGQRAFCVPKGLQPMDLLWSEQAEHHIWDRASQTSTCAQYLWCDDTQIRLGVVWSFGGTYQGGGRYLHDAYMYAVADSTLLGTSYDVTGSFSPTPVTVGNGVAQLQGTIFVAGKFARMHNRDWRWDFTIQGDGAGWLVRR